MKAAACCALLAALGAGGGACWPSNPCASPQMHLTSRFAHRYVGHWRVARGDTLTLPELGDRFKLAIVDLDTGRVTVGRTCRFRGTLIFSVPRAETLAVTWEGLPEQALIHGWPVDLGPFAGIGATRVGDSLVGSVLFDSRLGVEVRPGVTARFVAGRARD
ncbi:MAG TPA: hypothetical protein VGV12_03560 [Gemmatimonadales bacterium]|nr:hypothetical protein [Gemmatimonadales bacterium]